MRNFTRLFGAMAACVAFAASAPGHAATLLGDTALDSVTAGVTATAVAGAVAVAVAGQPTAVTGTTTQTTPNSGVATSVAAASGGNTATMAATNVTGTHTTLPYALTFNTGNASVSIATTIGAN